jgi:sodium transport system permease protein
VSTGLLALAARYYVSELFLAVSDDRGPGDDGGAPARADDGARERPPTSGEALVLFAIAYLLLYFVFLPLQRRDLISGLLISQWGGLLGLAALYTIATRRTPRAALGLRPAAPAAFLGALLMGAGGWMVANMAAQWVLPPPKEYLESFRQMLFPEGAQAGVVQSLLLFALTPAVCEELLFRGVLLRGLLSRASPAAAITACAVMFALFHIDIYRLVPTGVMGVMLAFIAWRSGSVAPAMLAHFVNNAIIVALGTAGLDRRIDALGNGGQLALLVGALALVAGGVAVMLRLPAHQGRSAPEKAS